MATPSERKCWDCGNVAMHEDNIKPWVLCKKCGSQDTRALKKQPSDKALVFKGLHGKVWGPDELGNMTTMGAGHLLCCEMAAELIRFRTALRGVVDGEWSVTGLQEILGGLKDGH